MKEGLVLDTVQCSPRLFSFFFFPGEEEGTSRTLDLQNLAAKEKMNLNIEASVMLDVEFKANFLLY
jgi:hypothetical protein